jgi:hypothetical protein
MAELYRTVKGGDFSLSDRPYLRDIYRCIQPFKPVTVIWKSSRKMEKTETLVNMVMTGSSSYPHYDVLYTTPRQTQASLFSKQRLSGAIRDAKQEVVNFRAKLKLPDSVHYKEMKCLDHYNHIQIYSAWNDAESVLSSVVDMLIIDEAQSMIGSAWFAKLGEVNTLSKHQHTAITGTARDGGDQLDRLWNMSDQREWYVTCKECAHEQILTFANIVGPLGGKYKGCVKCKNVLDVRNGVWKPTNPKPSPFIGFHTNQIMHPFITAEKIFERYETYPSQRYFDNEVMGISHSGGLRPITQDMFLGKKFLGDTYCRYPGCLDKKMRYLTGSDDSGNVGGMDWGNTHHFLALDRKKRIIGAHILQEKEFPDFSSKIHKICELMDEYNLELMTVDYGYAPNEVKELIVKRGDTIRSCRYMKRDVDDWIKYREEDEDGNRIYRLDVDRSTAIEYVIRHIKRGEVILPYKEESVDMTDVIVQHCCNLLSDRANKMEEKEYMKFKASEKRTEYARTGPDHFLHTLGYALISHKLFHEEDEDEFCMGEAR